MPFVRLADYILSQFPEYHIQFTNEYDMQLSLHLDLDGMKTIVSLIKKFKQDSSHKSTAKSDRYREEGNRLFRSNKKLNALEAGRCYTNAILAAPDGSKSLSLAHANRSAAIAEFGYYKEAYEDCQCAVDYGYPDENLQKIIVRQAYCAGKLEDYDKLKFCLEKLRKMTLSVSFAKQKLEFEKDLVKLKKKHDLEKKLTVKTNYLVQNTVTHPQNGQYATKDIAKGEEILTEKLFSLIALEGNKICSNCAAQNIIPFPCNICSKVFYCSLKCKQAQEMVHRFECYAYRSGLFTEVECIHLPLNTVLNGLPSIVPMLQDYTSPVEIWHKIEDIAKSGEKGYAEVLSLKTNLEVLEPCEIRCHSLLAIVVSYYLVEFTSFFTLFEGCACGQFEWCVIISALTLRHSAQIKSIAHGSCISVSLINSDFCALSNIWARPQHLKIGLLHALSKCKTTYKGIFPYFNNCIHSCTPSLRLKFNGGCVTATARHRLKEGAVIYKAYRDDFRTNTKSGRRETLKLVYQSDCKCKYCSEADDSECLKFHKYRCQNSNCQVIFTPPDADLVWWNNMDEPILFMTCPVCKTEVYLDWYWHFLELAEDPTHIMEVLHILNFSKRILVGYSEMRQHMALISVNLFFESCSGGVPLSRKEFKEIGEVLNYSLNVTELLYDVESVYYVAQTTLALDLMAQGYYFDFDCGKIRESFSILPLEFRIVFDNYIDDYIGDKFKDAKLG